MGIWNTLGKASAVKPIVVGIILVVFGVVLTITTPENFPNTLILIGFGILGIVWGAFLWWRWSNYNWKFQRIEK